MAQMMFRFNHPSHKAAIYGELDFQGVVEFAIEVLPGSPIRGTELFRRLMIAFGAEALAIRGVWRKGTTPSANIEKVNELTASGMPLAEAIHHTWTVTRAKMLGFSKVSLLSSEGDPGAYSKVDVLIEKQGE